MSYLKFLITIGFLFWLPNAAAGIDEANQYYQSKDYVPAFKEYEPLAKAGDDLAQTRLGIMYLNGYGVERNLKEAFTWFELAANKNYAEAQFFYAACMINGYGTYKNPEQAIPWFKKSAAQGNVRAQAVLSSLYMAGQGTAINYKKAFWWGTKATEAGNADAMLNIGQLYEKGQGVTQNTEKALYWYEQAGEKGSAEAQSFLGSLYHSGGIVAKDENRAQKWWEKAASNWEKTANNGNPKAILTMGNLYESGEGVPKSLFIAAQWYLKAIDQNLDASSKEAQTKLGQIYIDGLNQNADSVEAKTLIDKKAESGNIAAIRFLARFYDDYRSGFSNNKLVKFWYEKAAVLGDVSSQLALARLYTYTSPNEKGPDAQPDYQKALYWYKKIAEHDDMPYAQYELAKLYLYGEGIQKDTQEAIKWLTKAADKNVLDAQLELARLYKNGDASVKNYPKALALFYQLADRAYQDEFTLRDVAGALGEMYQKGLGVDADSKHAYLWYSLVVDSRKKVRKSSGVPPPPPSINSIEKDAPEVLMIGAATGQSKTIAAEKAKLKSLESTMTASEIQEAKKMVAEWKKTHNQ